MTNKQRAAKKLREAAALITNPTKHIKGALAANLNGDAVDYDSDDAVKFCMLGAIDRVSMNCRSEEVPILASDALYNAVQEVVKTNPRMADFAKRRGWGVSVPDFNDELATHEEALAAMYAAADSLDGGVK